MLKHVSFMHFMNNSIVIAKYGDGMCMKLKVDKTDRLEKPSISWSVSHDVTFQCTRCCSRVWPKDHYRIQNKDDRDLSTLLALICQYCK